MSNHVTATIIFSFKGKTHSPALELDLDQYMQNAGHIPDLCPLIAKANNFDLYSYEFEMMQAEPITFSHAKGLVESYVTDGILDINGFESAWHEARLLSDLESIAQNHMAIDALDQHDELKNALLEAYHLGKKNSKICK